MTIDHLAIWTKDLEKMRAFYLKFFDLRSNENTIILRKDSRPTF